VLFSPPVLGEAPRVTKGAQVDVSVDLTLNVSPSRVWQELTRASGFGKLTGFQPEKPDATLARVGDAVRASVWQDKGLLVVTGSDPQKELRVTWEPDNGSYLCQKRIRLEAAGDATKVLYQDRYTDTQPAAAVDQTSRQVVQDTEAGIRAFSALFGK
jgi:hypothetical protein